MADRFTSIDAFEAEVGLTLRALEDLSTQESDVEARYSKLEAECKQDFERQKNDAKSERLREASAAKRRRTEQEQKAHERYDSDVKDVDAAMRKRIRDAQKERERRCIALEKSRDWQFSEARRRAADEAVKLQESEGEAAVEAENRINAFTGTFEKEYDAQLSKEVKSYLTQVKGLAGAVVVEWRTAEQKRLQTVRQTSEIVNRGAEDAEAIKRLANEIDDYVRSVPRTFEEHSSLHTPVKLNRSHNALPAPFSTTAEARNQIESCHAAAAAIHARLESLNKEVEENKGKAAAILVGGGCLILLIIVLIAILLSRS